MSKNYKKGPRNGGAPQGGQVVPTVETVKVTETVKKETPVIVPVAETPVVIEEEVQQVANEPVVSEPNTVEAQVTDAVTASAEPPATGGAVSAISKKKR